MIKIAQNWRWALRYGLELAQIRPRLSFGLDGLDIKLLEFINFRRGFFVEAGGNDGLAQSNTAYLERYLGWRGILVEPIPELATRCKRNRPRAVVEQCALVPFSFPDSFIEMTYCNLMSLVVGARGSKAQNIKHIEEGRQFLRENEGTYSLKVAARTLTAIMDQHRVKQVDLLSLDVEGFEASVLQGIDFRRYRPRYILIEANNPEEIEVILHPMYVHAATLSMHDRLYMSRTNA